MLHDEWAGQLRTLLTQEIGVEEVKPRGLMTHEMLDWSLYLGDILDGNLLDLPARKLNYKFAVAEWLWIMFGHSDVATINQYNPQMKRFSDDGIFLTGAYGPHVAGGIRRVLRKLKADPVSRQAIIEIPRVTVETKDDPCTLSIQFLLRDDGLHCVVTMRSSDIWLGVPYDVFTFSMIQNCLAGELGVARGFFSLRAGSSHLYESDFTAASNLLQVGTEPGCCYTLKSPDLPGLPPAWLNEVLTKRSTDQMPTTGDDIWMPYARALCASSQAVARESLVDAHNIATASSNT